MSMWGVYYRMLSESASVEGEGRDRIGQREKPGSDTVPVKGSVSSVLWELWN